MEPNHGNNRTKIIGDRPLFLWLRKIESDPIYPERPDWVVERLLEFFEEA